MSADGGMLWCRLCETQYPPGDLFCPIHPSEELVPVPASTSEDAHDTDDDDPERPRTVCWSCDTRAENATNATCAHCHESLVPPYLVIEFPHGPVILRTRGTSAELGRAGVYGHVFTPYPNVSRWHATVSVDGAGEAWLTPNPAAPNGTFVNGSEIFARTRLRSGDEVRFAACQGLNLGPVSDRVREPQQER